MVAVSGNSSAPVDEMLPIKRGAAFVTRSPREVLGPQRDPVLECRIDVAVSKACRERQLWRKEALVAPLAIGEAVEETEIICREISGATVVVLAAADGECEVVGRGIGLPPRVPCALRTIAPITFSFRKQEKIGLLEVGFITTLSSDVSAMEILREVQRHNAAVSHRCFKSTEALGNSRRLSAD